MPIIKDGRLVDDPWVFVADGEPLPAVAPVIVSFARWQAEREALLARAGRLGVRLESRHLADAIGADAASLALIAIEFPTFRDGRGYSTARLLRERYCFTGELRACGDVLFDQLLFMHRCGFDSFDVADAATADAFAKAMGEFSNFYQTAADGRSPIGRLRASTGGVS